MRTLLFFAAALFIASPVFAADQKKAEALVMALHADQTMQQMRDMLLASIQQSLMKTCTDHGKSVERCQQGVPQMMEPAHKAFDEAFNWKEMEPEFVAIYANTLTDKEMDAAIAYYRSPEGQSLLSKLPQLMQQGGEIGKRRMQAIEPRLRAEIDEVVKKLEAEDKDSGSDNDKKSDTDSGDAKKSDADSGDAKK